MAQSSYTTRSAYTSRLRLYEALASSSVRLVRGVRITGSVIGNALLLYFTRPRWLDVKPGRCEPGSRALRNSFMYGVIIRSSATSVISIALPSSRVIICQRHPELPFTAGRAMVIVTAVAQKGAL